MSEEQVSDEELADLVGRVRSIRRRETLAKLVGVGLTLVLGLGLFALSFQIIPEGSNKFRFALAALGLLAGGFAYRRLSPKEHVDDLE